MLVRSLLLVPLLCVGPALAQDDANKAYITTEAAAADPDFAVQGEYVADKLGVQVVALGKGKFRVVIHRGGLPGDGWDGSEREVSEEDTAGVNDVIKELSLRKKSRFSPTLGAEPPKGAVVLFDGKKETFEQHWKQGSRITDDGLAKLKGLVKLRTLDLHHTAITDAGLDILKDLPELRAVGLTGTKVTEAGLAKWPSIKAIK